jgi:hypothetical protein
MLTEEDKKSFLEIQNKDVPEEFKKKEFEEFYVLKNVWKWNEEGNMDGGNL